MTHKNGLEKPHVIKVVDNPTPEICVSGCTFASRSTASRAEHCAAPLGSDEADHGYRPFASFTQRATGRLRTSRPIPLLGVLLPQPGQLCPLILARHAIPVPTPAPVSVHPVS